MSFTGKATYSAGSALPELAEDVADVVSIVSPYETPLLDHLGDPARSAQSTYHEWLEDALHPNTDAINDASWVDAAADTSFVVDNGSYFQVGDLVQGASSSEVMLVTAVDTGTDTLTVVRGYGGTTAEDLADDQVLLILGNAALEGADAPSARFTNRVRKGNYSQIFTSAVRVSGSDLAVRKLALADELDYQKQERLREMLRDLENTVLNGVAAGSDPQGSASVRRTMNGIIPSLASNITDASAGALSETTLNNALRSIWSTASASIDTIVVNGFQKRKINGFITSSQSYAADDTTYRNLVSIYESDFGVCRVILSRTVPADTVLLLDSSRIDVLPLAGRSFHYKPLAASGDYEAGEIIGEYTLELRNENAHGMITNLATS
jgi:hypothetical protein